MKKLTFLLLFLSSNLFAFTQTNFDIALKDFENNNMAKYRDDELILMSSEALLKNGEKYIFTRNRNYFIHNNEKIEFNGVVIYTNGEVYIPRNALNKIDKK